MSSDATDASLPCAWLESTRTPPEPSPRPKPSSRHLIGVLVGSLFFAVGRKLLEVVSVQGISVFPAEARPEVMLTVLVVLVVPLLAVSASLLGL